MLRTLKDLDVKGKKVLVRVDLNVPMRRGKVEDSTRISRLVPTLKALLDAKAKVIVLSHFGRPKGQVDVELSLAPLVDALSEALSGQEVKFGVDCIGPKAEEAVNNLAPGDIVLMENVRFHPGEEKNDPAFVKELAKLGECFVNDTFSCSHRAHASVVGLVNHMPSAAGLLLQDEIENLERILKHPKRPVAAFVGGSKISTKLELLHSLVGSVDKLIIGGAMANTFLKAQGYEIGTSLYEPDLLATANAILKEAKAKGCMILLPEDVVVAESLTEQAECKILATKDMEKHGMILDIGPASVLSISKEIAEVKTVIWNGPMGAFETRPFDVSTLQLARYVALLTAQGKLQSIAGGGDTVAALGAAGLQQSFTYISTAGGAFLEWLEGKELPGVKALQSEATYEKQEAVL